MVWRLLASSGFTEFYFPIEEQKKDFNTLLQSHFKKLKPLKNIWKPLIMLRKEPLKHPDFFDVDNSGMIAISQEALEKSKHFFSGKIELLPLNTDAGIYYVINILNTIDCLDIDNSDCLMNNIGLITDFNFLNFHLEKLNQISFFKISELNYASLVLQKTLFYFQENSFMGLEFDENVNLL